MSLDAAIEVEDLNFIAPPRIRLLDLAQLGKRRLPHILGPGGGVCYLDAHAVVLDRYDPGGTVLTCIDQAEQVLRRAIKGQSDEDFVDEFDAYWGGQTVYVDLPAGSSAGEVYWVSLRPPPRPEVGILTFKGKLAASFLDIHKRCSGGGKPSSQACPIVDVTAPLTVIPSQAWPPKTFQQIARWLEVISPDAMRQVERLFNEGEGLDRMIGLRAPNGLYILRLEIPPRVRKPEFLETRRGRLFRTILQSVPDAPAQRVSTRRVDADHLFGRNLIDDRGMKGKQIALIGCGAIGGALAGQLARSGAGSDGGQLTLIDPDVFGPSNLGRHVLGLSALGQNKASALAAELLEAVPHLKVKAIPEDALERLNELAKAHLVIDATGEEAFSIALNHHASRRRFPPRLHVWLVGNGAAAEALLCDERAWACYKCLKPVLSGPPRFRLLKPEAEPLQRRNRGCGDALYTPYPVSRGSSAAGLALDMALDWAAGKPGPRHRVRPFATSGLFAVKDSDPKPSDQCPACQTIP